VRHDDEGRLACRPPYTNKHMLVLFPSRFRALLVLAGQLQVGLLRLRMRGLSCRPPLLSGPALKVRTIRHGRPRLLPDSDHTTTMAERKSLARFPTEERRRSPFPAPPCSPPRRISPEGKLMKLIVPRAFGAAGAEPNAHECSH
jgi:hypothetical protein